MKHNGKEIRIKYLVFPIEVQGAVAGFTREFENSYLVGIDSTRAAIVQRHTLGHELAHIFLDHIDQHDRSVMEQEAEADREAWNYYRAYRDNRL